MNQQITAASFDIGEDAMIEYYKDKGYLPSVKVGPFLAMGHWVCVTKDFKINYLALFRPTKKYFKTMNKSDFFQTIDEALEIINQYQTAEAKQQLKHEALEYNPKSYLPWGQSYMLKSRVIKQLRQIAIDCNVDPELLIAKLI